MPFTREERFWKKIAIIPFHDCWEWIASKNKNGYGTYRLKNGSTLAHRYSYIINVGPIPPGNCILHKCDNRSCVRPEHLFVGTPNDNIKDMIKKGRDRKAVGERAGLAKLNATEIIEIRKLYGVLNIEELGKKYGVHFTTIARIVNKITWKHI